MRINADDHDNLSFGFAVLDDRFSVLAVNKNLAAILRQSRDGLLGKNLCQLIPPLPAMPLHQNHVSHSVSLGNGQVLTLDIIRVEQGKNSRYLLYCQDHSRFDHILEQIAISSKRRIINDRMLDCLYDGCYITDGDGVTLYVNDAFLEMSGMKREDVMGQSVRDMLARGELPKSCTVTVIESGKPASMIIDYYKGKSCLVTGAPVYIDGKIERVICTSRDMTELLALKDKLANATSLTISLKNQLREIEFQHTNRYVAETRSRVMRNLYDKAIKVASFDTPVLVLGETGVGKDFLVRFMHSVRRDGNEQFFIKVNCGAIPGNLLESELFGYESGAFTDARKQGKVGLFELAENGTMFLDEIGDMPLNLQVKLLDVIQDRTFYRVGGTKLIHTNARIVAATNANLEERISEGKFRSDLYYRLNVINVAIPPLRDRRDDIIPLAMLFLDEFNVKYRKSCFYSPNLLKFFMNYHWPGNIREMRNVIERLVILCSQDCIELDTVEEQILSSQDYSSRFERKMLSEIKTIMPQNSDIRRSTGTLREEMAQHEAAVIRARLKETEMLRDAAGSLGIDVSTLVRKKQKYGL